MKIICTPLSLDAMSLLDINNCPDSLLETIQLTAKEHEQLLKSGVLDDINQTLGKIIDDYEDESIDTPKDLEKTLEILKNHLTPDNSKTVNRLIHLTNLAITKKTGLFFFF